MKISDIIYVLKNDFQEHKITYEFSCLDFTKEYGLEIINKDIHNLELNNIEIDFIDK